MTIVLQIITIICFFGLGQSFMNNQPTIKLSNGYGYLLSRARPLQTSNTGLLSNIPRLEVGIRALFKSREAAFYDLNMNPFISMDWKMDIKEGKSHHLINFQSLSSNLKSIFNKFFTQIFQTASVIGSILKSSSFKLAQLALPGGTVESIRRHQNERNSLRQEYADYRWDKIINNLESSVHVL